MGLRKISNSETASWLHCRRKYYYEYQLDLEPKEQSSALSKGTFIHELLEEYYLAKMDGLAESDRRDAVLQRVMAAGSIPGSDIAMIGTVHNLVNSYLDRWAEEDDERYDVLAVETKFAVPMMEDLFLMAGTIDAIFYDKEDNSIVPVDHKSSYNFWTEDQAAISGQFLKYVYAMRAQGHRVNRFMINQLRTRDLKPGNDLFRRTWLRPTDTRIRAAVGQHLQVGMEIMEFRANPIKESAIPIFDKYGCANCSFFGLCDSEAEGAPVEHLIMSEYQKKKHYGYNKEIPA
jgi:hypothetical protein